MEAFNFLKSQDSQLKQTSAASIQQKFTTFSTERFQQAFPIVSSLFASEMCVNVSIGSIVEKKTLDDANNNISSGGTQVDTKNTSGNSNQNKSLAQQLRDEIAAEQNSSTNKKAEDDITDKAEEVGKQSNIADEEQQKSSQMNSSSSSSTTAPTSDPMRGRASGYAPRGRRGRAMAASMITRDQQQQQQQQQKEKEDHQHDDDDKTTIEEAAYEIFPPTILSDFKKSVSVDHKMPVNSERAFHALMNCVYLSILLRDRPYGQETKHIQEVAEKAVAFYSDKFSWECHRLSYKFQADSFAKDNLAFDKFPNSTEISSFISPFQLAENESEDAIQKKISSFLRTVSAFLVPISHSPLVKSNQEIWRFWTRVFTSVDDETSGKLCKCKQIAGRLENFRWQVIRKMIDRVEEDADNNKNLLNEVIHSVLVYWDPLSVLKRNFPLVYKEWFESESIMDEKTLLDIISSPSSYLSLSADNNKPNKQTTVSISPMSIALSQLLSNATAGSTSQSAARIAFQEEAKKFMDPMGSTVEKNSAEDAAVQNERKQALKTMAEDVLFLKQNGFPKSQQTSTTSSSTTVSHQQHTEDNNQDGNDATKTAQSQQVSDKIIDNDKLVFIIMKWWSVLLKEQCPVCCLKVY